MDVIDIPFCFGFLSWRKEDADADDDDEALRSDALKLDG